MSNKKNKFKKLPDDINDRGKDKQNEESKDLSGSMPKIPKAPVSKQKTAKLEENAVKIHRIENLMKTKQEL